MKLHTKARTTWSINEVAKLTGLTSRALRHYDAIGLLAPAGTSDGGRRYYSDTELLRLQEILLLRSLGLPLETIAETLADRSSEERIEVLARHLRQLDHERMRLDRLINTVNRTIQTLKEQGTMDPSNMFEGLIENPYEEEARQRWGDEVIDKANQRVRSLSKEDRELLTSGRGFHAEHQRLAALRKEGLPVDDPRVQEVIERHYRIVCLAWTPDAAAYVALGQGYISHDGFRKNIGQGDDALVTYLADAMKVYAASKLSA